jgi:hypothetical protein
VRTAKHRVAPLAEERQVILLGPPLGEEVKFETLSTIFNSN